MCWCCGPPRPGQASSSSVILICISTGGCCLGVETTIFGSSRHHLGIYQHHGAGAAAAGWAAGHVTPHVTLVTLVTCVTHSSHPHTRKHSVTRSHEPARDPARKVLPLHIPAFKDGIKLRSPTSYHQLMTAACSCNRQPSPAQLNNVHIKAGLPPAAPC